MASRQVSSKLDLKTSFCKPPPTGVFVPWTVGYKITPPKKAGRGPPYTFPFFFLCRLFGLLPTRILGRGPPLLYPCLVQLPLLTFFLLYKTRAVVGVWTTDKPNFEKIMIGLYICLGLPDVLTCIIHFLMIWKNGCQLDQKFSEFNSRPLPTMSVDHLSVIGGIFFITNVIFIQIFFPGYVVLMGLTIYVNMCTYFIELLFCKYLELVKAEMSEILPLDTSSTVRSILDQMELLKKATWANQFFSRQLLFISLRIAYNIVLKAYLFRYIKKTIVSSAVITFSMTWELFLLWVLTSRCNRVLKQVELFDLELFEMIRKNADLEFDDKLTLYINRRPKLVFSVFGFFNIGFPLVTSVFTCIALLENTHIISTSLSYIVILVQFSK